MARLPIPGSDDGTWGEILNQFLLTSHGLDGQLKTGAISQDALADGAVDETKLSTAVQNKLNATVTKADVGLDQVDNTSDINKPVSTATQTALDAKANIASLATVATSGDYNDLVNLPAGGGSDADVAGYIQNTSSSTYAALVALVQNIYATTYTPLSVIGTRTTNGAPTGAYPSGAAAGDVAIMSYSSNGGVVTAAPTGWSTLKQSGATGVYYGCSMGVYTKVLTSADITGGLTGWSVTNGVSYALHVFRGIDLPTDLLIQNGWTDNRTYQLPAMTATARAPKLVTTIMTTLTNPVASIEYTAEYTDFVEYFSGGTSYIAQALLQTSSAPSSFVVPDGHATWMTTSITLPLTNP